MNQSIQLRKVIPLFLVALAYVALSPSSRAVSPPPDGGYPNENTAEGEDALLNPSPGDGNTAVGFHALHDDNTGFFNTAVGARALSNNTIGENNTATGHEALSSNSDGSGNVANGVAALALNTHGGGNVAVGILTMLFNTSGQSNTAVGAFALLNNRTGDNNNAFGHGALTSNTGSHNIAIGSNAGGNLTTGHNNIDIGNRGVAGEWNTIRIGNQEQQRATYMAGIYGGTAPGGVTVVIGADGHLGTATSSARFKDEIRPMNTASEAIYDLRPVTFHYKPQLDPKAIPQFGLVAEDVEAVNPDLVVRDKEGKPYTVRYEAVNAMLLNEFLKEHRKNEEQQATIARLQEQIEALTAGLQKVTAQLEVSKSAPQVVNNNQ
jgi:endosialidase-like protein